MVDARGRSEGRSGVVRVHDGAMDAATAPARGFPRVGVLLWWGGALIAAALVLGAAITLTGSEPLAVDAWWMSTVAGMRGAGLTGFGLVMNFVGGGWFAILAIPLGGALLLLVVRRPWAAVFFLAAELVSALLVQVLKHAFGRPRPEDILVVSDFGSFPSGHVADAATIAVALWLLFPRAWVGAVGIAWTLLMLFSRTYLGAHWLSDTVGGALVGAGAVLLVAAALAVPLRRESRRAASGGPRSG